MKVLSTGDVSLDHLQGFAKDLGPQVGLSVDKRQMLFKSADPPSWVMVVADADAWLKLFGLAAGLFAAGFLQEAGADTWRSKGRLFRGAGAAAAEFGPALLRLRQRMRPQTQTVLAIESGTDVTMELEIPPADSDTISAYLGVFVLHAPHLKAMAEREALSAQTVVGAVRLRLLEDLSLEAQWMSQSGRIETRTLPRPVAKKP